MGTLAKKTAEPVPEACVIYMLTSAGWDEEKVLNMSLAKALTYVHCHLVAQGAATEWAMAPASATSAVRSRVHEMIRGREDNRGN